MALTKYEEGSIKELWTIALPLMISAFSVMAMYFVDRLLLAKYSTQALTAAVNGSTMGWAFLLGWMSLAGIAEVFVAQLNGAGQKEKLGEPVWQMIWVSFLSILFFYPLAIWGSQWLYEGRPLEQTYFSWMMLFGPSSALYAALCGFFVGQGKLRLITILAFISNGLNALLDLLLIFGVEGLIPPMGVKGAAISTSIGSVFQAAVLFYFFIKKKNREECGTGNFSLNFAQLSQCIKIGLPNSTFCILEVMAWAFFYEMMQSVSQLHITIAGVGQSLVILLFFFSDGLNKASATLTGNFIGAKRQDLISQMLWSGAKLHFAFFLIIFTFCATANEFILTHFFPTGLDSEEIVTTMRVCLLLNTVYLLFEGLRMLIGGALTAAGDTFFILVAGVTTVWGLMILPIYFIVVMNAASIETAIFICLVYSVLIFGVYLARYVQGKWRELSLIT